MPKYWSDADVIVVGAGAGGYRGVSCGGGAARDRGRSPGDGGGQYQLTSA